MFKVYNKIIMESSNLTLEHIANNLAGRLQCDIHGNCVHFAELLVLEIDKLNPKLLETFYVVEGYVDTPIGDGIPQQHTWIETLNGKKIDPTFIQFGRDSNYNTSRKRRKMPALDYCEITKKGTWFSDRRKKFPGRIFREEELSGKKIPLLLVENSISSKITEDIYGNKAVVYHRTKVSDLINRVYTEGFKPSGAVGSQFGKGFYATYDLKSQQLDDMNIFGTIIVKFIVNSLNRFFFFDYSEFVKSPLAKKLNSDEDTFIQEQIKHFNIDYSDPIEKDEGSYTNHLARSLSKLLYKKVDGLIYTARDYGRVIVVYNTDLIIPSSYSTDKGETFIQITPKNLEYLKKVFSQNTHDSKEFNY
jgi:hypothetical protein